MNTWKIIFATMVIFGTGVVTGGLLVRQAQVRTPLRPPGIAGTRMPTGVAASPASLRIEFLRRAQRELKLTAPQRERIDRLIKESQERTRQIMQPVMPELQAELQRTRKEFLRELTPHQRKQFEELAKQQHRPRDQRRSAPTPERSPATNRPAAAPPGS